jgi:hypothetical protein
MPMQMKVQMMRLSRDTALRCAQFPRR